PSYAQRYSPPIQSVDSNITAASLGTRAICALHTDTGCFNSTTDATLANCPAGTLTTTCKFPITLTIPANTLGSNVSNLIINAGVLSSGGPSVLFEIYLDSVNIFTGSSTTVTSGTRGSML